MEQRALQTMYGCSNARCGGGGGGEAGDAIAGEARVFYRRHSLCSLCVDSSIEQILYRSGDAVGRRAKA